MKNPKETAKRWLAQAEHSLGTTRILLENGLWADACFHSEQTAQLALKAFLYYRGRRFVNIHSVRVLASECGKEDAQFLAFESYGMFLDRYYLSTRYPDALPAPAIPFESFTQQEAQQALGYATEIVELVRAQIPTE
jgi:HEPN domain-containing protein